MNQLWALIAGLDWAGAVLGAIVSGAFAGSWATFRLLGRRRPLRLLLGQLADPERAASVFMRDMVSADGKYYSWDPQGARAWQNFRVLGQADVAVAGDVTNVLGQAGRRHRLSWREIERDFDLWSEPLVCVGGNLKTELLLKLCEPKLVTFDPPQTFRTNDGCTFDANDGWDYGLIYKGKHPQTGCDCFALFGFGVAGTLATGYFMMRQGKTLAGIYGAQPFAVILRARLLEGRESAQVVWMSSRVAWTSLALRLPTFFKYRRLLRAKSAG